MIHAALFAKLCHAFVLFSVRCCLWLLFSRDHTIYVSSCRWLHRYRPNNLANEAPDGYRCHCR